MKRFLAPVAIVVGALYVMGCSSSPPTPMAPPINNGMAPPMSSNMAPPMNGGMGAPQAAGVYQWQDVPLNQQVPIVRATFDQGGYQIFVSTGEVIVVPFVNQNLYVMKFGRTNGQPYFVNEGAAPVLYLSPGGYLENAAAQNTRWYPIPSDYAYSQPMYVSMAPSWADYTAMGWYPGMAYYGGMWGYNPYAHFAWMPGFYISIGGARYTTYGNYRTYYTSNPGYIRTRTVYTNYNTPRYGTGSFGRGATTGSFGRGAVSGGMGFGRSSASGSTGSFGSGRMSGGGFGASTGSSGSFGSGRSSNGFGS